MHAVTEVRRLRALWALDALDVEADPRFDRIVALAQERFDLPMVSITLIDADRQWRVAYRGPLQREGGLVGAICPVAMHASEPFVVPDTTRDPRFSESPYVTGEPRLRSYAGWPLQAPGGEPIGAFCVMDTRPRFFTEEELDLLSELGDWVETELHRGVQSDDETTGDETGAQPRR